MRRIEVPTPGKTLIIELSDPMNPFEPDDCAAIKELVSEGPAALPQLKDMLKGKDGSMRLAAANTLHLLAEAGVDLSECLPELIDNLKDTGSLPCKAAALIGQIGPRALPALTACLQQDQPYYPSLDRAMLHMGEAATQPMLRAMESGQRLTRGIALSYFDELFKIQPQWATPPMITTVLEALRDPDDYLAGLAALALGHAPIEHDRVVAGMIEAYERASRDTRTEIVRNLGRMTAKAAAAIPLLREVMLKGLDPEIREVAMWALCLVDKPNVNDILREYVQHQHSVTDNVTIACMHMQSEGIRLLSEFLGDPDARVRLKAAKALSEYDSPDCAFEALPALAQTLSDAKPDVRKGAMTATKAIARHLAMAVKDSAKGPDNSVLLDAAGKRVASIIPALRAILKGPEDAFRLDAVKALHSFGSWAEEAIPELMELTRHPKPALRDEAIKALAAINPDRAELMPLFAEWIDAGDPKIRLAVVTGLGRALRHAEQAAALLQQATADSNASVKKAANAGLKNLKQA